MDKIRLTLGLMLIILIALTIPTIVYYNTDEYQTENSKLKKQVGELQAEIRVLKTANLTAALGVIEEPPDLPTSQEDNQYCLLSHLWITGWVFNAGGSMAVNTGLNVLAFDETNNVLMNVTVPIDSYNNFDTVTDDALITKMPNWTYVCSIKRARVW